ncbi:MAG: CsgG/HfaB family protein [Phaeodactylibacter sp.]|nr:CsgG/HfaB family protein [Phaeodactylibacter sp.]MCB9300697.1 CsgG/HfaB family protein [Lewinellaceae bacterium]
MKRKYRLFFALPLLLFLGWGCGAYLHQPLQTRSARLGEETTVTPLLRTLPAPREKVVAAVYRFRDQTGQYKPSDLGANWSTAVTQGGANILINAMEESGWFIPIERENVADLLNERKIIRSSRAQYEQVEGEQPILPPLLFAGIILEGGIVSYDANILTGGAGLRYFGAGGSSQYRQDRVTVYLRAISTSNGKVLKTVYTSKTILSQAVDVGMFRFVRFKRLLEVETGFTFNEPSEMAVTEAIEMAVYSLVIEGVIDGLWRVKGGEEEKAIRLVRAYSRERDQMQQTDVFGRENQGYRPIASFEVNGLGLLYNGDYPDAQPEPGIDVGASLFLSPRYSLGLNWGMSRLSAPENYQEKASYADLSLTMRFLPQDRFSPFLYGGGGMLFDQAHGFQGSGNVYWKAHAGFGLEYRFSDWLGLSLSAGQNFIFSDEVDDIKHGKYDDMFWRARLGLKVFLSD